MLTRSNFPDLLDPAFRKVYTDAEKQLSYMYDQVLHVQSSSKNLEKDSSVSGVGTLVETAEGATVSYEDPIQGYDSTYTHKKYTLGTQITLEMMQDDQFNEINKRAKGLPIATNRTVELTAADVLNGGFTAGGAGKAKFMSGGDSYALFYASHPRSDGGTAISNTTTADLAEDSLDSGILTMSQSKDDKGQMMLVIADTLIVPPALETEARILLESTQRVGTGNNDINPMKGKVKLVVWPFIGSGNANGSDTAWYLLDSSEHQLNWYWRMRPGLDNEKDFDTGSMKYKVTARYSTGFSSWRGTYGSKGDNS